jgi:hypothetical protein
MRYARKLTLLAIAAIAAMAFMAPTASATDTVQVVNEETAVACGNVVVSPGPPVTVTGGCLVHAAGAATLRIDLGIFGEINEASCNIEIKMRVSGVGNVAVEQVSKTPGDANCATVVAECNLPWLGSGEEDAAVGVTNGSVNVCIDPAETDIANCQGALAVSIVESNPEILTTVFNNASVGLCELDVDLAVEHIVSGNVEIHINHP